MRITKRILLPFLILGFPLTGATLDGGAIDVRENQGVMEGSDVAAQACKYQTVQIRRHTYVHVAFLSPSYIFEVVQQNAYLPSAVRAMGADQAFVAPEPELEPSDFCETAKKSEKKLRDYVYNLLEGAATYFKSTKFTEITSAMNHIVSTTATFRDNIQGTLDAHHIAFDTLTEDVEGIFMRIANDLEKIPPQDKAPDHAERAEMVDRILDDAARELIKLTTRYGIEEEVVTTYLAALKPKVQALMAAVGDINERYPRLLPFLIFSVMVLLVPQWWILKPFLSLFGFGLAGPVKASAAAWMQSYFFGATVGAGSWFSWLQAAGMGVLPAWAGLVTKAPLLIGGAIAALFPGFNRG
ncbi:hypothetical protein HD554DRAFT_1587094 [Boletus coccyginus]|nr:hypothetical protein HD554DRAFT_1587094 [Boletus coccyginus]